MLKERLDPETFEQLKQSIPGSDRMLSTIEEKFAGSGLMNAVKAVAARFGGGDGQNDRFAAIEGQLAGLGLTPDRLKSLLPQCTTWSAINYRPTSSNKSRSTFPNSTARPNKFAALVPRRKRKKSIASSTTVRSRIAVQSMHGSNFPI
jgi:hypothetical protein